MKKANLKFRNYLLKSNPDLIVYAENIDKMSQEEFAEIRHNSFGASDSSRILGVNPFPGGSKEELFNEKLNRITNEEIGKKPSVRMGRDLEPLIMAKVEELTGQTLLKPTDMFLNKVTGQSVNFDGISYDDTINKYIPREIKTISVWGRKHYDFSKAVNLEEEPKGRIMSFFIPEVPSNLDGIKFKGENKMANLIQYNADIAGIPAYYYTQLQQQIDKSGAPYGTLTVMDVSSWTVYEYTIERAQPIIEHLRSESMFLYLKLKVKRLTEIKKDGE